MRTKKHNHKSWRGLRVTVCVAQNKKHSVPDRKRERGESTRILQPKSRTTLYVCVCAWMKTLLHYNLLTTDSLAAQAAWGRHGGSSSPSMCACVFLQSSVYLDQKICWWSAEGSNSDAGVNPQTHSLYAAVPRNYNKLKNKYKYSIGIEAKITATVYAAHFK